MRGYTELNQKRLYIYLRHSTVSKRQKKFIKSHLVYFFMHYAKLQLLEVISTNQSTYLGKKTRQKNWHFLHSRRKGMNLQLAKALKIRFLFLFYIENPYF